VVTLLSVAALGLAACGANHERTSGEEGEFITVGPATYQVQITRLLNPRIRPDDAYLRGQQPPNKDESYLGVFLQIKNEGDAPYSPPRDMKIVDTQGNEYLPLDATQSGFGLDFGKPIAHDELAPPPDSPAAEGPINGAMVLFRLKLDSATNNLPLELEVPTGPNSSSRIALDI
jgi:hypothetical protein